jgi:hypothetical protein
MILSQETWGRRLQKLPVNLRNMIFMRKITGVSVLNTVEVPGVVPGDGGGAMEIDRVLALWGGGDRFSLSHARHFSHTC